VHFDCSGLRPDDAVNKHLVSKNILESISHCKHCTLLIILVICLIRSNAFQEADTPIRGKEDGEDIRGKSCVEPECVRIQFSVSRAKTPLKLPYLAKLKVEDSRHH
jgi:hypothetical protein